MYPQYSACPCHTDCVEGCSGCKNPICSSCNVSFSKPSFGFNILQQPIYFRALLTMIILMHVCQRAARRLVNVYWNVTMTMVVNPPVLPISKTTMPIALARFIQKLISLTIKFILNFTRKTVQMDVHAITTNATYQRRKLY